MHSTGNFVRDLTEVGKRIDAQSRDRQAAERFGTEVVTMIDRRRLRQPVQMAVACIEQRAKDLVMRNKAGWARLPANPQKFILVDPQGCVLTDLAGKEIPPPIGAILKSTAPTSPGMIKSAYIPKVTTGEGVVTHIYADDRGNPTIGIGHRIRDKADLFVIHSRLGFFKRNANGTIGNVLATANDVLKDLQAIDAFGINNFNANHFRQFTNVDLKPSDVIRLRDRDIDEQLQFILNSPQYFPNFLTYPLEAQLALLDMVFNRGIGTVRSNVPSFVESVRNRDWKSAARLSEQVGTPSPKRKNEDKFLFETAARSEPFFVDPKCPRRPILQIAP